MSVYNVYPSQYIMEMISKIFFLKPGSNFHILWFCCLWFKATVVYQEKDSLVGRIILEIIHGDVSKLRIVPLHLLSGVLTTTLQPAKTDQQLVRVELICPRGGITICRLRPAKSHFATTNFRIIISVCFQEKERESLKF